MARQRPQSCLRAAETLLRLSELETQIARFYERLAEMFEDDQELGSFWMRLAEDELDHADALRSAAEQLWLMPVPLDGPLVEPALIARLLREIRQCEQRMTQHEASLDHALYCTLLLETSELNWIYQWLLDELPVLWTETLRSMHDRPNDHLGRVCTVIERFSQSAALRQQARALRHQWEDSLTA